MIKLWILGAQGMLGICLQKRCRKKGIAFVATTHSQADITDIHALKKAVLEIDPTHVINCAAYTDVEMAESSPDLAFSINAVGASNLATLCLERNLRLIHLSTDYVFDGLQKKPYSEDSFCNPINLYGKSKREGEIAILDIFPKACIIRTSWLFGGKGKNFIDSVLRWLKEKKSFQAADDQMSSPTYIEDLSDAILDLVDAQGVIHFCNTEGVSRYHLALEIQAQVELSGAQILCKKIDPAPSAFFRMKAKRPSYSVLATEKFTKITGKTPRPWKEAMRCYLHDSTLF